MQKELKGCQMLDSFVKVLLYSQYHLEKGLFYALTASTKGRDTQENSGLVEKLQRFGLTR